MKPLILSILDLTKKEKNRMLEIMNMVYEGVDANRFYDDLHTKKGIILMKDEAGIIQGFSTYDFISTLYDGEKINAIFSGDTVIHPENWGSSALFQGFAEIVFQFHKNYPEGRHYWFLISKGVRTYLMLPIFFKTFYPCDKHITPLFEQQLIRYLCNMRFPGYLDIERGILPFSRDRLRPIFQDLPLTLKKSSHSTFFLRTNPGFTKGEELVCLCSLEWDNFTKKGLRFVKSH
ncbi:MAG: hypothetical protein ACD_79C01224G0001 [uncultured bacterium]|nr:MAG: hypothetical protein ACD_79C01224G0001 [uncultured bacterium]